MRLSIRWKLILSIGLPLLVAYTAVVGVAAWKLNRRAYERMQTDMAERVAHYAIAADAQLESLAQIARSTATILSLSPDMSDDELFQIVRRNVQADPLVYGACVAFEPNAHSGHRLFAPYAQRCGDRICTKDLSEGYDYTQPRWQWYAKAITSGRAVWTEPYFDEGGGNRVMCTYSVPFARQGQARGVVTVDIAAGNLQQSPLLGGFGPGSFAILSREGHFISHPDPTQVLTRKVQEIVSGFRGDVSDPGAIDRMLRGESGSMRFRSFRNSEPAWLFYAPIRSAGWSLAAAYPESQLTRFMYEQLRTGIHVLIAGLVVMLIMLLVTASRISRPMIRLSEAVAELGRGNFDLPPVSVDYNDEIGDLARAFNNMIAELRTQVQALTRETAAREAVESELRIARTIQTSLLPRTFPPYPERLEFQLHAVNAPARLVAGDFFDFFFVGPDRLTFIIADVSGKGVPAALLMAVTRTIIRNLAHTGKSAAEILTTANRTLFEDSSSSMFVTLFIGQYDTATGTVVYANAGHPPPYRVTADGNVTVFGEPTGLPLGVVDEEQYSEGTERLRVGETLVLFTDGVPEAQNPAGALYQSERLMQRLAEHPRAALPDLCAAITRDVDAFQEGDRSDDVTLLVLRRTR